MNRTTINTTVHSVLYNRYTLFSCQKCLDCSTEYSVQLWSCIGQGHIQQHARGKTGKRCQSLLELHQVTVRMVLDSFSRKATRQHYRAVSKYAEVELRLHEILLYYWYYIRVGTIYSNDESCRS